MLDYLPIIETRNNELSNASFSLGITKLNNQYVLDFIPRGVSNERLYSNSIIPFNTWSFITLTRKDGLCSMFVNGTRQQNTIFNSNIINSETNSPIIGLSKDKNYFHGYINDFRITKECRYNNSFDYPQVSLFRDDTIDPYFKDTSLILDMNLESSGLNKKIIDKSYYNLPITGSGQFNLIQSGQYFGNACLEILPGSGNIQSGGYLSIPNSSLFNLENKDFTIEFWYKRNSGQITGSESASTCCPGWYGRFFTTYCSGGGFSDTKDAMIDYGGINILMEKNSTTGSVYFRNNSDSNFVNGNLTFDFIPENWTNYIVMRSNNIIYAFKSGQLISSINVGTKSIFNNSTGARYSPTVNIGGTVEGYHSLNGSFDSFRITKNYARYPDMLTGLTTGQQNRFISLYKTNEFDDYEIINLDMDISNIEGSVRNNVKSLSISNDGAGYFSGNSFLALENSSDFNLNTGNFTVEFWFKNLTSGNSGVIFKTSDSDIPSSIGILLSGNNTMYSNFSFSGTQWNTSLNMGTVPSGEWNHYAFVRNTGTFFGYKNGFIIDTKTNPSTQPLFWNTLDTPVIGGKSDGKNLNALLDEFRITKGIARYTENFIPKTKIENIPSNDKHYYNNILTIPFIGENNETNIKDYSIITKNITNNNTKILNNIKVIGQYINTLQRNNLLIYWNFSSNSPTPTYQFGSYTINTAGTPSYVTDGPLGSTAARLNGTRIILRNNLWNHCSGPYTSYTVSAWIRKNASNSNGQQAVYMGSNFGNMGVSISEPSINNSIAGYILTGPSYASVNATYASAPPINAWMHIVFTNDYPNKRINLFYNGTLVATNTYTSLGCTHDGWNGIALNGSVVGTTSSEYGNNYDFAFVSLWDRNLSNEEVRTLYNNPRILD
jgi:hypothetical protein